MALSTFTSSKPYAGAPLVAALAGAALARTARVSPRPSFLSFATRESRLAGGVAGVAINSCPRHPAMKPWSGAAAVLCLSPRADGDGVGGDTGADGSTRSARSGGDNNKTKKGCTFTNGEGHGAGGDAGGHDPVVDGDKNSAGAQNPPTGGGDDLVTHPLNGDNNKMNKVDALRTGNDAGEGSGAGGDHHNGALTAGGSDKDPFSVFLRYTRASYPRLAACSFSFPFNSYMARFALSRTARAAARTQSRRRLRLPVPAIA